MRTLVRFFLAILLVFAVPLGGLSDSHADFTVEVSHFTGSGGSG